MKTTDNTDVIVDSVALKQLQAERDSFMSQRDLAVKQYGFLYKQFASLQAQRDAAVAALRDIAAVASGEAIRQVARAAIAAAEGSAS